MNMFYMPPQPPEPSEWQTETDAYGVTRRYRMIGNVKEYEKMITVAGAVVPESQLKAYNERKKANEMARLEAAKEAANNAPTPRNCPFNTNSMHTDCTREACALYLNGCALAQIEQPAKVTEGLQCPFSKHHGTCRTDCALYRNGCTLTGIFNRK